jgi:hypothetical protein
MSLFVFTTENCRNEASEHGWQDRLESFALSLEQNQSVRMFEPFPPPYLVKKKFGEYAGRLVAAHVPVGEDSVVVLLSALIKGTHDYDNFSEHAVEYGRQNLEHLYINKNWAAYVDERKAVDPPKPKAAVGEDEYGYLHDVLHHASASGTSAEAPEEDLVCESSDWVERCAGPTFQNWHALLHEAVIKAANHDPTGGKLVPVPGKSEWSVLLRNFPQYQLLWLVAPVIVDDKEALEAIRTKYGKVLNAESPSMEDVLKASRRAYPAVLLADANMWMNLQKEAQANMALSPEESKVLRSARRTMGPDGDLTGGFPMFINGRAGSGKTTILQYLFAEFLFYHLTQGLAPAPPIYFTCNAELLRHSRSFVKDLLRCNASWWHHQGNRDVLVKENEAVLDGAFKEFHQYLISLVEPEVRVKKFPAGKYVGYAEFKQLWEQRFRKQSKARKDYGPDLSWHVIRSYIKGISSDELLDPDEYRQLDKKQVTVTQETYETVFLHVWERWYKPLSETDGHWDDQDLARHLIDADDARRAAELESEHPTVTKSNSAYGLQPVHPAIFCDESQDFTRIELEVILRLSLFSERALGREEVSLAPFVFAGDPFQTLNPTGFRWDAIKAFFVEKFIFALATHRPKTLDLNYQELTYNYRSSRSIVRFSNYVQALRTRLFELTNLHPQQPWEHETNPPPVTHFSADNDEFWERLKKETDVAVIVPCAEGEELDFIRRDPVLNQKIKIEDGAPQMIVLSAVGAKGLEFTRVVVYGFGEAAETALLDPLRGKPSYADDVDRVLPFQYFINRLYVAVSRAKRRLFIVDSAAGFQRLWDFAHDEKMERSILDGMKKGRELWGDAIARLEEGRADDLSLDRASDPLENAANLARDGRSRGNALNLLQAANIYRNNGNPQDAIRCKADALRIEGKFIEAAEQFLGCKDAQRATDCFWRAERVGWTALFKAGESNPELVAKLEYAFARALSEKTTFQAVTTLFERLADRVADDEAREETVGNPAWAISVRAVLDALRALEASQEDWLRVFMLVEKIVGAGMPAGTQPRAMLAYRAGQLDRAVKLWDSAGERGSQEYRIAKAFSAPFPEKLAALHEIGKRDEIIAEFERHPAVALSREQSKIVGKALLSRSEYDRALTLLVEGRDSQALAELIIATQPGKPDLALRGAIALFAVAAAESEWSELLPYVEGRSFPFLKKVKPGLFAWIIREKAALDLGLMRALGRADALGDLKWEARREKVTLRPFADYLRKVLFPNDRPAVGSEYLTELGAAIERTGSRVNALAFYEAVRGADALSGEQRQSARERWVVCKERHARFLAQDGDAKGAALATNEARKERERMGMKSDDKLPEYPDLNTLSQYLTAILQETFTRGESPSWKEDISSSTADALAVARSEKDSADAEKTSVSEPDAGTRIETKTRGIAPVNVRQEWTVEGLRFEFFRDIGKLVITSANGATASIKPAKRTCVGDDVEFVAAANQTHRYNSEDWDLIVDMSDATVLVLEFSAVGLDLRLRLA